MPSSTKNGKWTLREFPEFATNVGDNHYNDKLTDLSAPAMERRKGHDRAMDSLKSLL